MQINKTPTVVRFITNNERLKDFLVNAGFEYTETHSGHCSFYWANTQNDLIIMYLEKLIKLYLTGREPN